MIIENCVDVDIPDWQMKLHDIHRVRIRSTIVYRLSISKSEFERSVKGLAVRTRSFKEVMRCAATSRGRLAVIDSNTIKEAREFVIKRYGTNYVDQFIYDTERSVTAELSNVLDRSQTSNFLAFPAQTSDAVQIRPARSFDCEADRQRYSTGPKYSRTPWTPSVRLEVDLELEGQREAVEAAAAEVKAAMLFCGPVTTFTETSIAPQALARSAEQQRLHIISA